MAKMIHIDEDNYLVFEWHGGAYIEVSGWDGESMGPTVIPTEVINVWDYSTDEAAIGQSFAEFEQACNNWLNETF